MYSELYNIYIYIVIHVTWELKFSHSNNEKFFHSFLRSIQGLRLNISVNIKCQLILNHLQMRHG